MLIAALFNDVPKRLGGILTISSSVETENTFKWWLFAPNEPFGKPYLVCTRIAIFKLCQAKSAYL
jgi:hypothetical protein